MKTKIVVGLVAAVALVSGSSLAAPILAAPGDPAFDAKVGALADGYLREQDQFSVLETGLALNPVLVATSIPQVQSYFAQSTQLDFQTFAGVHPFTVIDHFEEYEDEGNFAGISTVGVAARLMFLKSSGASEADIAQARDVAIAAARAWHVYGAIGGPGVVARGIRRTSPLQASAPPLPGMIPDVVALNDAQGNPLPTMKSSVWRAPVAAGFDGWIWTDDTSKDQVSGYALAAAWLWDALSGDSAVPSDVTQNLVTDLVAFAKALATVAPELGIDLCIRDADGRLTSFHDLNPRQVTPDAVIPEKVNLRNGFNAALALGIVRAAYHVSGDPDVGAYYYDDLVGTRDLPGEMTINSGAIFMGAETNYSNVNMLAIAMATLGRFETDPYVRSQLEVTLQSQFWSTGDVHDVSHVKQAWFDVVYGAFAALPKADVRPRVLENLGGFQTPPALQRDRENCDATEIAAGVCTAIDGVTQIVLSSSQGHNGTVVAADIVPMSVRPDSDFLWRTDPHEVNDTGSNRMNPGGDFLAAYWLARVTDGDDTSKNLTPNPRMALPYMMASGGAGGVGGGGNSGTSNGGSAGQSSAAGSGGIAIPTGGIGGVAGASGGNANGGAPASSGSGGIAGSTSAATAPSDSSGSSGCGCNVTSRGTSGSLALLLALGAHLARRRTRRDSAA